MILEVGAVFLFPHDAIQCLFLRKLVCFEKDLYSYMYISERY